MPTCSVCTRGGDGHAELKPHVSNLADSPTHCFLLDTHHIGGGMTACGETAQTTQVGQCQKVNIRCPSSEGLTTSISACRPQWGQGHDPICDSGCGSPALSATATGARSVPKISLTFIARSCPAKVSPPHDTHDTFVL